MVKNASGKQGYRSFTVLEVGKHGGCKTKFGGGGKYVSKNPGSAVKKAFRELCRIKRIRGVCTLVVTIRETTQGSKKKVYSYKCQRKKLPQPKIMMEGTNNEYVIEYKMEAKATTIPPSCKNPSQTRGRQKKYTSKKNRKSPNNVRKSRRKQS
jgi:hypothetical protein